MYRSCVLVALLSVAACGGSSNGPDDPDPTGVTVTVTDPLRMGQTTQATATEAFSSGQSQPLTAGFRSDATGVATVTDAGVVTAISNGHATIYLVADGFQGDDRIRVVPDYHGTWTGGLRVTACAQSGAWASAKMCDEFPANSTWRYTLSLDQSGESMNASLSRGAPFDFPDVDVPLKADGSASFVTSVTVTDSGFTATLDETFTIHSSHVGELTGTVKEVWHAPNITGELRLAQTIVSTTRTSPTPSMAGTTETSMLWGVLQKLPR